MTTSSADRHSAPAPVLWVGHATGKGGFIFHFQLFVCSRARSVRKLERPVAQPHPRTGHAEFGGPIQLVRHFTLFVIDVATRRVHVAGTTTNPTSTWMEKIARNLTDCEDGFLNGRRFLIIDRDAKFSRTFKSILEGSGVEILLTSYLAPNMNAHAERFVRSIKSECLDQMIFPGRKSLVRAISEYADHYHEERSHQGIGNELISAAEPQSKGDVASRERLGGLLKYYHRRVA
jgi:putative transposase